MRYDTVVVGAGLGATRSHIDPQGVRTEATVAQLRAAWT